MQITNWISFHKLIMWGYELLMTVSIASISVLHYAEIAYLYPQAMLPICQGIPTPIHQYQGSEAG
jgi:hypothetical protein